MSSKSKWVSQWGDTFINMEAYVVPEIASIPNTHMELAKPDFPKLKGL